MGSFRRKIANKFKNRYRLILRQDDNLEEKVSIVLEPLNLVLLVCGGFFLFGSLVYVLLAYTPLNYIFPTKSAKYTSQEQYEMIQKIDSLEIYLEQINLQSEVLESVLSGDELSMDISNNELAETQISITEENQPSEIDLERPPKPKQYYSFFIPVKGVITDSFNIQRSHLGIDIAAKTKEVIKAIQNGTVIYSGWTSKGGHTIIIQHSNNFISVYKHNAVLLKKTGTFVSAGDAVALVGNTGELSSGPHLHFELWKNGLAVNPLSYLNF